MKTSARNVFSGKVSAITAGAINTEIEITTGGGDKLVAIVTQASVRELGLALGKEAFALVKAPWVILMADDGAVRFSARNQLPGTVQKITRGAINTDVVLALAGGTQVHAVVTNEAVVELGLQEGSRATALIKASHVVLGVPA
ncbi:transporter [Azospira sp. I13]|uniref:TOBE domain-containing protein n=1 Tax=Azospira sp. I13 TaxID=1765050 RepID=UPI000D4A20BC|nr:TOBE domain-containing protein [Azospira sp. I13]GBG02166.1 transporter [Azospira sp. I13]